MAHGLAIRRGSVSILCNGRPSVHKDGTIANKFKGDEQALLFWMRETEDNKKRVFIPQNRLATKVDCVRCKCIMNPAERKRYMENIYKNSIRWKNRKEDRRARKQSRIEPLTEARRGNITRKVEIPAKKTCIIQISFV